MREVQEYGIRCPYCDEHITILVDLSVAEQSYIEDCEVCCRPMTINAIVDGDGHEQLNVYAEND